MLLANTKEDCILTISFNRSLEILSIIPARGGSKAIPRKNIKLLKERPLLSYTAESSRQSSFITRHILSTDDDEIAAIGQDYGLEVPFMRPTNLSRDDSPSIDCFKYTLQQLLLLEDYTPDYVVILQPTSPLRTSLHIDEAIQLFLTTDCDSLVSIVDVPHNMTPSSVMNIDPQGYLYSPVDPLNISYQRQRKTRVFARNGAAIYITTPELILSNSSLFGPKLIGYLMTKLDSIDIDDYDDWILVEALLQWRDK